MMFSTLWNNVTLDLLWTYSSLVLSPWMFSLKNPSTSNSEKWFTLEEKLITRLVGHLLLSLMPLVFQSVESLSLWLCSRNLESQLLDLLILPGPTTTRMLSLKLFGIREYLISESNGLLLLILIDFSNQEHLFLDLKKERNTDSEFAERISVELENFLRFSLSLLLLAPTDSILLLLSLLELTSKFLGMLPSSTLKPLS